MTFDVELFLKKLHGPENKLERLESIQAWLYGELQRERENRAAWECMREYGECTAEEFFRHAEVVNQRILEISGQLYRVWKAIKAFKK